MKQKKLLIITSLIIIASLGLSACTKSNSLPAEINSGVSNNSRETTSNDNPEPSSELSAEDDLDTLTEEIEDTIILEEDFSDLE